jgi:paraquat-inducible protein B
MSEAIDSLSSMFPQVDRDIIIAVFDQQKGNVEACIPQLLEISDPSYQQIKAQAEETDNNAEQIKKDEEYARKLAQDLSDEEYARQLQEEEARNRQMEIERERREQERNEDNGAQFKERITAGFETVKQKITSKASEFYEKIANKANEQRNMNRNQYSNLPDNNEDSLLLGNSYETQEQYNARNNNQNQNQKQNQNQNQYSLNGNIDEEESLDRRNPNF